MDWCVDTSVLGARGTAEGDICAHLARHALDPTLVQLARPVVASLLADAPAPRLWVSLDWAKEAPSLEVRPIPESVSSLPGTPLAPGVTLAHLVAASLMSDLGESPAVSVELGLLRAPESDFDPAPTDPASFPAGFPAALGLHMAEDMRAGWDLEAAAARAGATIAAQVAASPNTVKDLESAVAAFITTEEGIGGHFDQVVLRGNRAILGCRRCPFGPSPAAELCRFTSALAGGLGARLAGSAEVVLDERIAMGDPQCRLVLDVGSSTARVTSHSYHWPPESAREPNTDLSQGFRVALSLLLPRDRLSIPVTRHLARAALTEVGVNPEDAYEVELALSEACTNVVEHSGAGDSYEVSVVIGPANAELRVIDRGRSFEPGSPQEMASHEAERGRGIALMHALVDRVRFDSRPEFGTLVHLVKKLRYDTLPDRRSRE